MKAVHIHNKRVRKGSRLLRADPTRTTLIRRQFQVQMRRRFNLLKRDVFEFIFTLDALGFRSQFASGPGTASRLSGLFGMPIARNEDHDEAITTLAAPQPREFQFLTDANKVKAFRDWLKEQVRLRILSPSKDADPGKPWTGKYIESAYKKGRTNAFAAAKQEQALADQGFVDKAQADFLKTAFGQPETTKKIELLATRSFEELSGITEAMAQKLNRVLANGMVEGLGARDIAKQMVDEIEGITNQRALVLARTEVIHAHAEGQLDSFTELGVEEVGVEAEWSTAGDDRVCPECEAMEGKTFSMDEAHGMIPLHPNCRCTWIPAIPGHLLENPEAGSVQPDPALKEVQEKSTPIEESPGFPDSGLEPVEQIESADHLAQITREQTEVEGAKFVSPVRSVVVERDGKSYLLNKAELEDIQTSGWESFDSAPAKWKEAVEIKNPKALEHIAEFPGGTISETAIDLAEHPELKEYVDFGYLKMNDQMRKGTGGVPQIDKLFSNPTTPMFEGSMSRGVQDHLTFELGDVIKEPAFSSFSVKEEATQRFSGTTGTRFVLENGRGINIGGTETEVLLPKGMVYQVTSVAEEGDLSIVHLKAVWGK